MSNLNSSIELLVKWDENYQDIDLDKEVEQEPKTFNCIAKEEDLLQMYLKDVGKTKLLKKYLELKNIQLKQTIKHILGQVKISLFIHMTLLLEGRQYLQKKQGEHLLLQVVIII